MSLSNTTANLLIRISMIGVQLALVPIAMTTMGKDAYGVWMAATSLGMVAIAVDFGTLNAAFNLAARSRHRHVAALCALVAARKSALVALLMFALTAVVAFSIDVASALNSGQSAATVRQLVLLTVGAALVTLPFSVFNQLRLARLEAARIAPWLVTGNVASFVTAWAAARLDASPSAFVAATLLPPVIAQAVVALVSMRKTGLPLASLAVPLHRADARVRHHGAPFFVVQLATLGSFNVGNLLVAGLLSSNQAAEYALANRYFSVITTALAVYMSTAWPMYARLAAAGDHRSLRQMFMRNVALSVGFAVCCCALLFAARGPFFEHWTRATVSPGNDILLALAGFVIVNAVFGNVSALMNATGQLQIQAVVTVAMLLPNLALSVVLVRRFGPAGTATSSALCAAIMLCIYLWHWKQHGVSRRS